MTTADSALGAAPAARRLSGRQHTALAAYWFGLYFLFTPVGASLTATQIDDIVPGGRQQVAQGLLLGAGAFFATVLPPLVGAWSDRMSTRWGRRRPIVLGGTVVTVLSLLVMMTASTYQQLLLGYVAVQIGSNAAGAAYSGLIPDVVAADEVGRASGALSTMVLLGSAGGLGANVLFAAVHAARLTYVAIAAVLVAVMVPTLRVTRGEGRTPARPPATGTARQRAAAFLRPLRGGDFAWVVGTRMLITAGISTISPFTFYFFRDVVGVSNPDLFNPVWLLVVLAFAAPLGFAGGRLSDRHGRKRFVYASGGLQAFVAVVFIALYPTAVPLVLALGAVYGVGYGLYIAVDWALACDTLPQRDASAKDMGLFHVALSLPGNIVPAVAGLVLSAVNAHQANAGYRVVFSFAIVFFLLGTVLVRRVRSVR